MNVGDYVRTNDNISKIIDIRYHKRLGNLVLTDDYNNIWYKQREIIKSSPNIIDLIEYMDLLWVKHPVKLYDSDTTIGLFNPVRCDGFTTFKDGTHCIILNLDYIVDIKDLKIEGIITHEQIENMKYKVGE